ncbi:Ankyrin repeat and SOCS box protein 13 [Taenia crassiceps]|uniref:Ankyrin repeat and SOCS box protein 13 n=1 Tax=Taenia crassiceps TaxID=6207 RepID=A0ABR4QQX7_9CEST
MLAAIKTIETGTREEILQHLSQSNLIEHDPDNNTLLHYACLAGNLSAVNALIEAGFYVNANNVDGHTPICDAAANGSVEIIRALIRGGANVNPLAYWGSPLINAVKNDVNACDRKGFCPIHVSVKDQFYPAAEYLLMAGADPNKRVRLTTALHIAAELNDLKMVQLLLRYGAFASPIDFRGRKPIDFVDEDSSVYKLLSAYTGWVPSLQFLSRLAIKRQIPSLLPIYSSRLDLPSILCDYLTFKF